MNVKLDVLLAVSPHQPFCDKLCRLHSKYCSNTCNEAIRVPSAFIGRELVMGSELHHRAVRT